MVSSNQFNKRSIVVVVVVYLSIYLWLILINKNDLTSFKNQISNINYMLSISRGGFCYRGATLWNQLPNHLRKPGNDAAFKKGAKSWVVQNIPIKPT